MTDPSALPPEADPGRPEARHLRAGAAKVDITPGDLTALNPIGGGSFSGVHDPLHLRALVMSDGATELALVATDLIEVGNMVPVRDRIASELGIRPDHVILTASHSHSAPRLGRVSPGALAHDGGPESAAYSAWVYDRLIDALKQARDASRPAQVGFAVGSADVNVNRDVYVDDKWGLGHNADGPSDKAVRVVSLQGVDGEPIAVVMNYAVHSVVTLGSTQVSADLAGAAADEVERRIGGDVVALWTLGSVADQNPRIQLGFPGTFSAQEVDAAFAASDAQGLMIAAEVVRVVNTIGGYDASPRLHAAERVVPCPPKRGVNVMKTMRQVEVDAVELRLILLLIGDIALAGVSGEVTTRIAERLRREAPLTGTVLVSMANDRLGYLPEDEAYDLGTFEANGSPIQQGHGEAAIVGGLLELMEEALR